MLRNQFELVMTQLKQLQGNICWLLFERDVKICQLLYEINNSKQVNNTFGFSKNDEN